MCIWECECELGHWTVHSSPTYHNTLDSTHEMFCTMTFFIFCNPNPNPSPRND